MMPAIVDSNAQHKENNTSQHLNAFFKMLEPPEGTPGVAALTFNENKQTNNNTNKPFSYIYIYIYDGLH